MPISSGTKLGRYEIRSQLGAGGMGEVYLAQDTTELDRTVALKILPLEVAADKDRLQRFTQEARTVSNLNHPNILTIYEFGQADSVRFIATEFIDGETLRQHLSARRLKLVDVLDIAVQIVAALNAAHEAGVVHRDIKPENVMVRRDHIVKVLDFGLAKLTEQRVATFVDTEAPTRGVINTEPGVVMGTAVYMSPEQARGLKVDTRTDIFSFGVLIYEMIAGRLPFEGSHINEILASILNDKDAPPLARFARDVPAELERIVEKALRKDREERYQSAKDILLDLKRLKQRLEVEVEIERTVPPELRGGTGEARPSGGQQGVSTAQASAAQTATVESARTTSSAEYIISEIRRRKRSLTVALAVLLLAAVGFGYWFSARRASNATQIESIAVLPFVDASGNSDIEYLSDGLTESLITSLSQLPRLSVKARSTVFHYKGKDVTPQQVGSELSVQAVLNGRVVQRGDQLTLSLELVDARTGNQIWGEQYNRKTADLVSLQREIARDVSSKLQLKLSGADEQKLTKNYTVNAEAYQLYLRGRFYWNKRTPADFKKSIEYFQQAIAVDPNYALAYAGLADGYALLSSFGVIPPHEGAPKAREFALKALSLDNSLGEPHATLALKLQDYDFDFAGAEREFKISIALNPNYATAHQWFGEMLGYAGRFQESFAEFRRALEIDPLSLPVNWHYGRILYYARKYDESLAQLKKTLELDANFQGAHGTLACVYQAKGNYAESVEEYAKSAELIGESQNAKIMRESFAKGGWQGFLRVMTAENYPFDLWDFIIFQAELGERDKAFAVLNKAYESRRSDIESLKVEPLLDPLRNDPRFAELLRRVGLPQ
jgi:serine/threonine-protein kinase